MTLSYKWLTYLLIVLNGLMFFYNYQTNGNDTLLGTISAQQLIEVGGMNGDTSPMSWITSMFQHASFMHILLNMISLLSLGVIISQMYGNFLYIIGYFATGLVGNIATVIFTPETTSVGASGAIFGLLGMYVVGGIVQGGFSGLTNTIGLLIPQIIATLTIPQINIYAHFGGLIAGIILGIVFVIIIKLKDFIIHQINNSQY